MIVAHCFRCARAYLRLNTNDNNPFVNEQEGCATCITVTRLHVDQRHYYEFLEAANAERQCFSRQLLHETWKPSTKFAGAAAWPSCALPKLAMPVQETATQWMKACSEKVHLVY